MIADVSLRGLYLIFQQVLGMILLMSRMSSTKDVELLVLRHEVAVLRSACSRNRRARPTPQELKGPVPAASSVGARRPGATRAIASKCWRPAYRKELRRKCSTQSG